MQNHPKQPEMPLFDLQKITRMILKKQPQMKIIESHKIKLFSFIFKYTRKSNPYKSQYLKCKLGSNDAGNKVYYLRAPHNLFFNNQSE